MLVAPGSGFSQPWSERNNHRRFDCRCHCADLRLASLLQSLTAGTSRHKHHEPLQMLSGPRYRLSIGTKGTAE